MSFQVLAFATLRISSVDVRRSRDWYARFFDREPVEEDEKFASFKIGSAVFDISLADALSPSSPGGSVGYWQVDDLEAAIVRATELGGTLYRGPLDVPEVGRRIAQIRDPIGNVFGLEAEIRR
jgi:predicted enzyme related to lactoylglutathione lyase